jgi:hypothetical protein
LEDRISVIEGWILMHCSWQDGPCKNYILKVASVQQNDIWDWTIVHYPHGYDNAWSWGWEVCIIFKWVVAKQSQFHNWILVATFVNFEGSFSFKVKIIV